MCLAAAAASPERQLHILRLPIHQVLQKKCNVSVHRASLMPCVAAISSSSAAPLVRLCAPSGCQLGQAHRRLSLPHLEPPHGGAQQVVRLAHISVQHPHRQPLAGQVAAGASGAWGESEAGGHGQCRKACSNVETSQLETLKQKRALPTGGGRCITCITHAQTHQPHPSPDKQVEGLAPLRVQLLVDDRGGGCRVADVDHSVRVALGAGPPLRCKTGKAGWGE